MIVLLGYWLEIVAADYDRRWFSAKAQESMVIGRIVELAKVTRFAKGHRTNC